MDPKYQQPLNPDQIEALFAHYDGSLRECLEGMGYHVSDAPSLQEFTENVDQAEGWNPMNEVLLGVSEQDEYYAIVTTCERRPANLYD